MRAGKQLGFQILDEKAAKHFGGAYLKKSHAKVKRPVTTKKAMHLVLRSSHAKGSRSLLRHAAAIQEIIKKQSSKFGVRVYRFANAGNHIHMVILPSSRQAFHHFVRSVSGLIARKVLGVERGAVGESAAQDIQFWDQRPFTRILEWGREYKSVVRYLVQNSLEALGFITYTPRVKPRAAPT